ncbi:MAG: STAS domain-containing protein, partial [Planctomycetota bacterium]
MDHQDLLKQAQELLQQGDYEETIRVSKSILDQDPQNPEAKRIYEEALEKQWQEKKKKDEEKKELEEKKQELLEKSISKDILREALKKILSTDLTKYNTVAVKSEDILSEKKRILSQLEEGHPIEEAKLSNLVENWVQALKLAPEYEDVRSQILELQQKYSQEELDHIEIDQLESKLFNTLKEIVDNSDIVELLKKNAPSSPDAKEVEREEEKEMSKAEKTAPSSQPSTSGSPAPSSPKGEIVVQDGPLTLNHEIRTFGGADVLYWKVIGPIDSPGISQLEKSILGSAENGHILQVVDFSQVKYINSTGMGTMVKIGDMIHKKSGEFCLVNVQEKVVELFNMLGLLAVIKIEKEENLDSLFAPFASTAPSSVSAPAPESSDQSEMESTSISASSNTDFAIPEGALDIQIVPLQKHSGVRLAISGPIDTVSVGQMEKAVVAAFEAGNPMVLLDFDQVKYINSTGMGILVKLTDTSPGPLYLVNVNTKVKELLQMMGMLHVLKIVDNEDEITGVEPSLTSSSQAQEVSEAPKAEEKAAEEQVASNFQGPKEFEDIFDSSSSTSSADKSEKAAHTPSEFADIFDSPAEGSVENKIEDILANATEEKVAENLTFRQVSLKDIGGKKAVLLQIEGAVDTNTFSSVENKMQSILNEDTVFLVLDFHKLDYINSTGMGLMVKMGDQLQSKKGGMVIIRSTQKIRDLFSMLGLSEVVEFQKDLDEALTYFQSLTQKDPAMSLVEEGNQLREKGDIEGARKKWEEALKQAQDSDKSWIQKKIDQLDSPVVEEDETERVGKSEMNVEKELIDLIEKGNKLEKQGKFEEAIAAWEEAMTIAHYKGGLQAKIEKVKEKLRSTSRVKEPSSDHEAQKMDEGMEELDKELAELSEEVSQEMTTPVPPSSTGEGGLDDLFGDSDSSTSSSDAKEPGLDDLFGETTPAEASSTATSDTSGLDDLFGDSSTPQEATTSPSTSDGLDDLFGDSSSSTSPSAATSAASGGGDELDELFGDTVSSSAPAAPTASSPAPASADGLDGVLDEICGDESQDYAGMVTEAIDASTLSTTQDEQILSYIERGDQYEREGNLEAALKEWNQALQIRETEALRLRIDRVQKQLQQSSEPSSEAPTEAMSSTGAPTEGGGLDLFADDDFGFDTGIPASSPSSAQQAYSSAPAGVIDVDQIAGVGEKKGKGKLLLVLILLLILLGGGAFVGYKAFEVKSFYTNGFNALNNGKYDQALENFEKCKGLFAFLIDTKELELQKKQAHFRKIMEEAQKFYEENKEELTLSLVKDLEKLLKKAKSYAREDEMRDVDILEKDIQLSHLKYKIRLALQEKQFAQASKLIQNVLRLKRTDKEALKMRRQIQEKWKVYVLNLDEKNRQRALEEAKNLANTFPENLELQELLVTLRQKKTLKQVKEALDNERIEEARDLIETHLKKFPSDSKVRSFYNTTKNNLFKKLEQSIQNKEFTKARQGLEKLTAFLLTTEKRTLRKLKKREKTIRYLEKIHLVRKTIHSNLPQAFNLLKEAEALATGDQKIEVAKLFDKAIQNGLDKISILGNEGEKEMENKNFAKSNKLFQNALVLLDLITRYAPSEQQDR